MRKLEARVIQVNTELARMALLPSSGWKCIVTFFFFSASLPSYLLPVKYLTAKNKGIPVKSWPPRIFMKIQNSNAVLKFSHTFCGKSLLL